MKLVTINDEANIANSRENSQVIDDGIEYVFEVVIEPDEDRYHAYCPSLKGCRTWGRTEEEAYKNIHEVLELYLEALIDEGRLDQVKTHTRVDFNGFKGRTTEIY